MYSTLIELPRMTNPTEDVFKPADVCSICGSEYDEDEGGIQGYFGMMPVTFCVWCYSSMIDMAKQELEGE